MGIELLFEVMSVLALVLGFTLPFSDGPLTTFHLEWMSGLAWLLVGACFFFKARAVRATATIDARLVLWIPGSILAMVVLDFVAGRFAYTGQAVLYGAYVASAMATCWLGWQVFGAWRLEPSGSNARRAASRALGQVIYAVVIAAVFNGFVALSQYLGLGLPTWMGVPLPENTRAFGNLRQANLYALLMVLGVVASMVIAWQVDNRTDGQKYLRLRLCVLVLAAFLGATMALSLSRTGAVMIWAVLLGAWAGTGLTRLTRAVATMAAVSHGAGWILLYLVEQAGWMRYRPLATVQVLPGGGNFSSFRSEIWTGMLKLVGDHPFVGSGTASAGYAYFMRELPVRVDLNMQHAHNLPLQLAVEHGAIFTVGWLVLIAVLLWRVRLAWTKPAGRLLGLVLLAFAIHSSLEYPLWYLYFLLPCAFALGGLTALGTSQRQLPRDVTAPAIRSLAAFGVLAALLLGAVGIDYQRILPAFRGTQVNAINNLEGAYGTWLFTYCVDYVVAANIPVTPENARTHYNLTRRLSKTIIQPFTLINLSLSSAMLGKTDEAAFYLRRIQEMSGTGIDQVLRTLTPEEKKFLLPALQQLGAVVP